MFKVFNKLRVISIVCKTVPNARGWREKWVVVLLGYCRDCLKVRLVTQIILTYITNSWWFKWGEVFRYQRINNLIKEDEFVLFFSRCETFPPCVRQKRLNWCRFSDQFKEKVKRYIRVEYNLDIIRQSACLVLNPITVYSYGFLFNCTTVGQASDSMTALT